MSKTTHGLFFLPKRSRIAEMIRSKSKTAGAGCIGGLFRGSGATEREGTEGYSTVHMLQIQIAATCNSEN